MSMMKPVDNHTTSIGMTAIMGSRTGRFTRNDNSRSISVASTPNGSFLLAVANKNFVQDGARVSTQEPRRAWPPTAWTTSRSCVRAALRFKLAPCAERHWEP
jgi:hypothetical protein